MDVREKLVELLRQSETEYSKFVHETSFMPDKPRFIADNLIANGVTLQEWVSVEDRLPEAEKRVLVSITRHSKYTGKDYVLTTCAIYEDGKVDVEDSCWMCEWGDYDEDEDVVYVPKGWYEYHEYGNTEEDGIGLIGGEPYLAEEVTHWMPLPEPPEGE